MKAVVLINLSILILAIAYMYGKIDMQALLVAIGGGAFGAAVRG